MIATIEAAAFTGQVVSAAMMLIDWQRRQHIGARRWAAVSLVFLVVVLAVEPGQ